MTVVMFSLGKYQIAYDSRWRHASDTGLGSFSPLQRHVKCSSYDHLHHTVRPVKYTYIEPRHVLFISTGNVRRWVTCLMPDLVAVLDSGVLDKGMRC
jgi:hypothetical protein